MPYKLMLCVIFVICEGESRKIYIQQNIFYAYIYIYVYRPEPMSYTHMYNQYRYIYLYIKKKTMSNMDSKLYQLIWYTTTGNRHQKHSSSDLNYSWVRNNSILSSNTRSPQYWSVPGALFILICKEHKNTLLFFWHGVTMLFVMNLSTVHFGI